jgi:hypothetical protein
MGAVYRIWLLSRDERFLSILGSAFLGLALLSHFIAKLSDLGPPAAVAVTSEARPADAAEIAGPTAVYLSRIALGP